MGFMHTSIGTVCANRPCRATASPAKGEPPPCGLPARPRKDLIHDGSLRRSVSHHKLALKRLQKRDHLLPLLRAQIQPELMPFNRGVVVPSGWNPPGVRVHGPRVTIVRPLRRCGRLKADPAGRGPAATPGIRCVGRKWGWLK